MGSLLHLRSISRAFALPLLLVACTSADTPDADSSGPDAGEESSPSSRGSQSSTSEGEGSETTGSTDSTDSTDATSETGAPEGFEIIEGQSVGPIALESTFGSAVGVLGEPDLVFVTDGVGFARYDELGLELVFSSPEPSSASDDAIIFALGVKKASGFFGDMMVGQSRDEVGAEWGAPADTVSNIEYFGAGISAMYDAADEVEEIGIFAAYENAPEPPEMANAPRGDQP